MGIDWKERLKRQEKDEEIYGAIRTGNYRAALTELLKEVRGVTICEHGNITTYQSCPQCVDELDELTMEPDAEDE